MKAILLDADGVVLQKEEYFSERFAREHNVPIEEVMEFFNGPFKDCQTGIADMKDILPTYLEKWGWKDSIDSFMDYWFRDVEINPEIENFIERCNERGIKCYLASNNEIHRARHIEKLLGQKMDGYFFSADLRAKKDNTDFFDSVLDKIGLDAQDVTFMDDDKQNIEAALELGINAKRYRKEFLDELLSETIGPEFKIS